MHLWSLRVKIPLVMKFILSVLRKYFNISDNMLDLDSPGARELLLNPDNKSYWLILRCHKCDRKSIPIVTKGKISPASRYCRHCGSDKFYLQKREDIERLDTIYALYSKDIVSIRQGMVSHANATLDRSLNRLLTSQTPAQAWDEPGIDFVNNVIPFERYYSKNK